MSLTLWKGRVGLSRLAWHCCGMVRAQAGAVSPSVGAAVVPAYPAAEILWGRQQQKRQFTTSAARMHKLPDGSDCGSDHGANPGGGSGSKLTRLQHLRRENEVIAAASDLNLPSKVSSALIDAAGGKGSNQPAHQVPERVPDEGIPTSSEHF